MLVFDDLPGVWSIPTGAQEFSQPEQPECRLVGGGATLIG
jgi:hypothetical protein